MANDWSTETPDAVLDLWFPRDFDDTTPEVVADFWTTRMQGGMDAVICDRFADLTIAAAEGRLDHWAETSEGRLALILALDQFPRSLWRETPAAFGQDIKSARLALEGIANGHFAALDHIFKKQFYIICISHCEGPDHLSRMDLCVQLNEDFRKIAPPHLQGSVQLGLAQGERVRKIIAEFGRHPHRNPIYGRISSRAEQAYIDQGDFPHQRKIEIQED